MVALDSLFPYLPCGDKIILKKIPFISKFKKPSKVRFISLWPVISEGCLQTFSLCESLFFLQEWQSVWWIFKILSDRIRIYQTTLSWCEINKHFSQSFYKTTGLVSWLIYQTDSSFYQKCPWSGDFWNLWTFIKCTLTQPPITDVMVKVASSHS